MLKRALRLFAHRIKRYIAEEVCLLAAAEQQGRDNDRQVILHHLILMEQRLMSSNASLSDLVTQLTDKLATLQTNLTEASTEVKGAFTRLEADLKAALEGTTDPATIAKLQAAIGSLDNANTALDALEASAKAEDVPTPPSLGATATTVTAPATGAVGSPIAIDVKVEGTDSANLPSGTVVVFDGTDTLGTVTLDGTATGSLTVQLDAGTHSLTGVYSGDSKNATSTSSAVTVVVA